MINKRCQGDQTPCCVAARSTAQQCSFAALITYFHAIKSLFACCCRTGCMQLLWLATAAKPPPQ